MLGTKTTAVLLIRAANFFLVLGMLIVIGCGPSLNSLILLPNIPVKKPGAQSIKVDSEIKLEPVEDVRGGDVVASLKGKEARLNGDILGKLNEVLRESFKTRGYILIEDAPLIVKVQLKSLFSEIVENNVSTSAVLILELDDPANRKIYSAKYEGTVNLEASGVNTEDVRRSLGVALAEAINAVHSDEKLKRILTAF